MCMGVPERDGMDRKKYLKNNKNFSNLINIINPKIQKFNKCQAG